MLDGRCLDLAQARTEDEFRRHMIAAAGDLGFGLFGANVILDHSPNVVTKAIRLK